MTQSLATAYVPFRATLLAGGFHAPDDGGWSAEQVAAHIALNNDYIAAAAEAVARGESVECDNEGTVDDAELARFADRVGGLSGLAREVERSALRLEAAHRGLGERSDVEVPVRIRDGGEIVRDQPMAIGAFVEGNASFHLDIHHEQLKALQRSWTAEPPDELDSYQLVLLTRPARPLELDDAASAALQREHLGHFAKMRAAGVMTVSGPIDGDELIAGISIYTAGSVDEARILAADDPAVQAGRFEVRAMDWFTAKGALARP